MRGKSTLVAVLFEAFCPILAAIAALAFAVKWYWIGGICVTLCAILMALILVSGREVDPSGGPIKPLPKDTSPSDSSKD